MSEIYFPDWPKQGQFTAKIKNNKFRIVRNGEAYDTVPLLMNERVLKSVTCETKVVVQTVIIL